MRKISLIGFVMLIVSIPTFAGGLLTNTNQHVAFLRMLARGASIDIDGVYSNPAGLAFLPGDGLYLSLNGQSAYQTRNIDMTFPLFPEDGTDVIIRVKLLLLLFLVSKVLIKKETGLYPVASPLAVEEERLLSMTVWECSIQW